MKTTVADSASDPVASRHVLRGRIGQAGALGLLLFLVPGLAAGDTGGFRFLKAATPGGEPTRNIAVCDLDEEVLDATADDYSDLRVFDQSEKEIPVLLRQKKRKGETIQESDLPVKQLSLEVLQDNRIQIVFEVEASESGRTPSLAVFSTAERDYEKQVTISGSNDRQTWTVMAEKSPIFDYSRFFDIRNSTVSLRGGPFTYYRVEVANISESAQSPLTRIVQDARDGKLFSEVKETSLARKDFRIDRIRFVERRKVEISTSRITRSYTVRNLNVRNDTATRETVITFDVANVPLTALEIEADDTNYSRQMTVQGSDAEEGKADWHFVGSGAISRITLGSFNRKNSGLEIGQACRYRHYRMTIRNLDSPPLNVRGVRATGEVHEAVFFREPGRQYSVFYGGNDMDLPRYDIADVLSRAGETEADVLTLGAQQANPKYMPPRMPRAFGSRTLLVVAILAMTVVLVWLIAVSAGKVNVLKE